ncbi:MAG: 50S ribosomal protein L30 [Candidatus Nitrosopolaris sp.]
MAYLVVRMRGTINVPSWAKATLTYLNLTKKYRATLISESQQSLGMLRKVKGQVAWTPADPGIIKDILEKRGRKAGFKPISNSDLPKEYDSIEQLASAISENKISISEVDNIKPWFALTPPRGGFKRKTKNQYNEGGLLGECKDLVAIVRRML